MTSTKSQKKIFLVFPLLHSKSVHTKRKKLYIWKQKVIASLIKIGFIINFAVSEGRPRVNWAHKLLIFEH